MLAILDYKAGNQTSVRRALDHLGIPCTIAEAPALCGIKGLAAMLLETDRYAPLIWQRMAVAQKR